MNTKILERADELGLKIVETTSDGNGYPRNLKKAITGFVNFADAERFAEENGCVIIELKRKAGRQLWSRGNRRYEAFDMRKVYENVPNCEMYFCGDEDRLTEHIKSRIAELDDFSLIKQYVENSDNIWSAVSSLWDDEFVIVIDEEDYQVKDINEMRYEYDSTYYKIGVIENE